MIELALAQTVSVFASEPLNIVQPASWGHILSRAAIHFFSSAGVILISMILIWLADRTISWWPKTRGWMSFVFPILMGLLVIAILEFDDVSRDGAAKSYVDVGSWITGMGVSVWGLYRLIPRLNQILAEIKDNKKAP